MRALMSTIKITLVFTKENGASTDLIRSMAGDARKIHIVYINGVEVRCRVHEVSWNSQELEVNLLGVE